MTAVRVTHAVPRPGRQADGRLLVRAWLIILADDEGSRALPLWLVGDPAARSLRELVGQAGDIVNAGTPEELAARLLRAVGAGVTSVAIEPTAADSGELNPQETRALIELSGPAGSRQVTARPGLALALAVAAGAPVRVPDAVMDRLAVPVTGGDLLGQFLDLVPPAGWQRAGGLPAKPPPGPPLAGQPARRPRFEPRNLSFADGLDWWDLDGSFLREADGPHRQDYAAAADGASAILRSAVPDPTGSAALVQTIFADDYRGTSVVFRAEIRTQGVLDQAGLRLEILWRSKPLHGTREDHAIIVAGSNDWTRHEIRTRISAETNIIRFGIGLAGPGLVALRSLELACDA